MCIAVCGMRGRVARRAAGIKQRWRCFHWLLNKLSPQRDMRCGERVSQGIRLNIGLWDTPTAGQPETADASLEWHSVYADDSTQLVILVDIPERTIVHRINVH